MQIEILYFARLREAFGREREILALNGRATVADVVETLAARGDPWTAELRGGRVVRAAVNEDMASPDTDLRDGDVLALFPPVTGG